MKLQSLFITFFVFFCLLVGLYGCAFKPDVSNLTVEKPSDGAKFEPVNGNPANSPGKTGTDENNPGGSLAQPPGKAPVSSDPLVISDSGMNSPWKQINAPIKNTASQRSAQAYLDVISQFNVQSSYPGRYRPGDATSDTRCNIFAGDVLRAMGTPLPTKGELGKGAAGSTNTDPMTANAGETHDWLNGQHNGWRKIDVNNPADLQLLRDHLRAGKPAVASDSGHIAVLRPDNVPDTLGEDNLGSLHIAQAGAYNYNDIMLKNAGYGSRFNPDFYIND